MVVGHALQPFPRPKKEMALPML